MQRSTFVSCTLGVLILLACNESVVRAGQVKVLRDGTVRLQLTPLPANANLSVQLATAPRSVSKVVGDLEVLVDPSSQPSMLWSNDGGVGLASHHVRLADGLRIAHGGVEVEVFDLLLVNAETATRRDTPRNADSLPLGVPYLELHDYRVGASQDGDGVFIPAAAVKIPSELAAQLGDPALAQLSLGTALFQSDTSTNDRLPGVADEVEPAASGVPGSAEIPSEGGVAIPGPDMVFCQLYGLQQFGRLGEIVGLAQATTSWNRGTQDLIWLGIPDNRHPFIISNLYRLKNDRFEQIGMSHVKHGFFALGDTQCGGSCTYQPGHGTGDWLGTGCTDTYTAGLNASQSGLGPRNEMNGWTGAWTYAGSHMASGHAHDGIQHRIQVHDADLDNTRNIGASYFSEAYYLTIDDVDPMNSAAWKSVTITGGVPGSTWTFGMSSSAVQPAQGFAIDAWPGARKTTLALEVPPVRGASPDGRSVLAAKATALAGGVWSYEYALLNVDMHRKGGSFSIPIPTGVNVTNVGFHAVESHNEPYSNTPWTSSVTTASVTWSTTNNPLRWATMYNFRFNADAPPGDVTATLGLFEPGAPTEITGITTGPFLANPPVPEVQTDPSGLQKTRFVSVSVPPMQSATAAGLPTALRVTLDSLHHVTPPYTGGSAADFSAFEGRVRWVGPPAQFVESQASGELFYAAVLQCAPYYADWSAFGLLHITGNAIVPSSVYLVENVAVSCQGDEANCTDVSAAKEFTTTRWGDIVVPYNPPTIVQQPDIADVSALVNKFRDAVGAPKKAQAAIAGDVPDLSVDLDFSHIAACVDAFKGQPYPYAGPSACP